MTTYSVKQVVVLLTKTQMWWGAAERERLRDFKLQWDCTLANYIDRRLIELQIGWSDLLTVRIISASDHELSLCSHADLQKPWHHISLDVWRLYIRRMEQRGGMSESGRLSSILGTCGAYRSLNLSPSLEDWENLNIVHAPPTFCLLSQELLCDWVWLDRGKVGACPGHRKHKNLSLCWEPCSCFSPDTLDLLHLDFSHSSPCLLCPPQLHIPAYTCQTLT